MKRLIVPVLSAILLAGGFVVFQYSGLEARDVAAAKTETVSVKCQFAYRKSSTSRRFERKTLSVEVLVTDGPVPEIGRIVAPKTADLGTLRVEVLQHTNSLIVRVRDKESKKLLVSNLYQIGPNLRNQFHGGHGFTGLSYLYHPKNESELQFWCEKK